MEKYFTYFTDHRGLISKIYINTQKLAVKKTNNAIKKWNSDLNKKKIITRGNTSGCETKKKVQHP